MTALLPNIRATPFPLRLVNGANIFYRITLVKKMLCHIKDVINKFFIIHFGNIAGMHKQAAGCLTG